MRATMFAAVWCVVCVSARPATLHVAQTPNASDENAGTPDRPLATIACALSRAAEGDTVLVHGGVYREEAVSKEVADLSVRRTLAAAPGEAVAMSGSDRVPGPWTPSDVTGIGGVSFRVWSCPWPHGSQMVFVDDQPLQQIGLQGSPARARSTNGFQWKRQRVGSGIADMTPGSFVMDSEGGLLTVRLADDGDPSARQVEASVRACALSLSGTWTLSGIEVRNYQDDFWPREQAVAVTGDNVVVENCRILHNECLGLIVSGQDGVIRGNEIGWNGLMGLTSNVGHRMRVEGNEIHHNAWRGDVVCLTAGNKWVTWRDSAFLRNHFHDEPATALWLDISDANILIAENRFEDCAVGVYFEISRWAVIANNVFLRCGRAVWSYSSDVLIAQNVLDRCGEGVMVSGFERTCSPLQLVSEPHQPDALMAVRNNWVVNNVLVDCVGAYVGISEPDAFGWGNFSDYNALAWTLPAFHLTGLHINFLSAWDAIYARLPIWRIERHCDEHSTLADARLLEVVRNGSQWVGVPESDMVSEVGFVDREAGDYRLRPDSPLVGRGVRIPGTLDSPYTPGAGNAVVSRAFALTASETSPEPGAPEIRPGHYRLQPLPATRPLLDLASLEPGTPGLAPEWREPEDYPRFALGVEPLPGPTSYSVGPANLLLDGSFDKPMVGEGAAGGWVARGMHAFAGMACANLAGPSPATQAALQRVGSVRPGERFVLCCEISADSGTSGLTTVAEAMLAVGPDLRALGAPLRLTAQPGRRTGWQALAVEITPEELAQVAQAGEELHIVLTARTEGTGSTAPDAAAFVRFDHVVLLGSRVPAKG